MEKSIGRKCLYLHFPDGYWYEDTINAFLLFLKASRFVSIDDTVYYYLINNAGISSTSQGRPKSVDAFYVTRSVMKDALSLNSFNKMGVINTFLHQIKCNYFRTYLLGEEVRKAVFVLTIEMYNALNVHKGFADLSETVKSPLINALKTSDFELYEKSCIL